MKVFYCTSFTGHYPVGVCALVVAKDVFEARTLLTTELQRCGLVLELTDEIQEVDTSLCGVNILSDGMY